MTRPSDASTRRLWLLPLLLAALGAGSAQPIAASMQATVDTQLRAWQAIPASQQQMLQTRLQAWDALPLEQRDDQRSRYQAWLALQETERARLRQSAREFALLLHGVLMLEDHPQAGLLGGGQQGELAGALTQAGALGLLQGQPRLVTAA